LPVLKIGNLGSPDVKEKTLRASKKPIRVESDFNKIISQKGNQAQNARISSGQLFLFEGENYGGSPSRKMLDQLMDTEDKETKPKKGKRRTEQLIKTLH